MSRQKELAKNTVILTVGKICTQFISFLLLPLYTALLNPEEFGIVDLLNTYITLLVPIFNWQFENGLFRFMLDCREDKNKQKELFSTVFVTNIFQSLIYVLFFLVFQNYINTPFKIFLAIDVVLNIFLNTLLQFPRGIGKNLNYSVASFLSASLTVVLNVVFIAGLKMGAYGMFMATIIAKIGTIIYIFMSLKVWSYFSVSSFKWDVLKGVSKYSIPLIPNQLSWWVVNASDRVIISNFINIVANGIYSVANKFSGVYSTFYNIFYLSWSESVSLHIQDDDKEEFITETINTMFNLFAALCIGIIACMPFVFPIMVNEQYQEAYNQIPILMFAALFQVVVGLYSAIYVGLKKSVEITKTSLYAAGINIVVNLALIKFIGLYAASVSTLAAYALMAIYRYFHVKKYINIPIYKKNMLTVLIVGVITMISYYCNIFIIDIIVLIGVCVYAYVMNRSLVQAVIGFGVDKIKSLKK